MNNASGLPLFHGAQLAVDMTLRGALPCGGDPMSTASSATQPEPRRERTYRELAVGIKGGHKPCLCQGVAATPSQKHGPNDTASGRGGGVGGGERGSRPHLVKPDLAILI